MAETIRHSWQISPQQSVRLQRELAPHVRCTPLARPVRTIAGVDCAFFDSGRQIVAVAVLMQAKTLEIMAMAYAVDQVRMPYVPGLLSFREAPTQFEAVSQLPQSPDLVLVDGAGQAHPRRLGIASHLGLWLGIPTVGVAKSRLCGRHRAVGRRRGCCVKLIDGGEVLGGVLRTRDDVKPLYVSAGHLITLAEAIKWTLRTARQYRLPEPIRAADRIAGQLKTRIAEHSGQFSPM